MICEQHTKDQQKLWELRAVAGSGTNILHFYHIFQAESLMKKGELLKKKQQAPNGVTCAKLHVVKLRLNT